MGQKTLITDFKGLEQYSGSQPRCILKSLSTTLKKKKKERKSISRYHPRPIKYDFLRVDPGY